MLRTEVRILLFIVALPIRLVALSMFGCLWVLEWVGGVMGAGMGGGRD